MADPINLSFPDQSYSTSNPPSAVTLKDDLTAIEDAHNDMASDVNDHETRLDTAESSVASLLLGWIPANETWTYSSVDNPIGIITVPSNATLKYSVGMRIRFVNGGNTIYGIIVALTATTITFLHEIAPTSASTDGGTAALNLMANSAITLPYYSMAKVPFGFPSDIRKWTVETRSASDLSQSTPVAGTWYNLGSYAIDGPIGLWIAEASLCMKTSRASTTQQDMQAALSSANNAVSGLYLDTVCTARTIVAGNGAAGLELTTTFNFRKKLSFATKTTLYLLGRAISANSDAITFLGATNQVTITRLICAHF